MAPFFIHGHSYESLQNGNMMSPKHEDGGSIGSNTFRSQRRRAYDKCETDEQIFNQHNIQSIYDNRHHDLNVDEDIDSSLGGYSSLGDAGSKGSIRTREELRMSLIARRRRLAQLENAMDGDGSIDFSLSLNRGYKDAASLVSSLRDSIISLNDSLNESLLSKKPKKSKGSKDRKKKSKKKPPSKDKERRKRKDKKKHKHKDREKAEKLKKSEKQNHKDDDASKVKKAKVEEYYISDASSCNSENYDSKNLSKDPRQIGADVDRNLPPPSMDDNAEEKKGDMGQAKAILAMRGKSMRKLKQLSTSMQDSPASVNSGVVYYACNGTTGMCAFHPDVQLRKKSRFGGWKDVLKSCPKCFAEAQGPLPATPKKELGGVVDRSYKSAAVDRSNRSGISSRGAALREGEKTRGMPLPGETPLALSQKRLTDDRRRNESDSSSSSSSSSSEPSKKKIQPQQLLRRNINRRGDQKHLHWHDHTGRQTGDSRGVSQPPNRNVPQPSSRGMSQPPHHRPRHSQRGSSHPPQRSIVDSRHPQWSKEMQQPSSHRQPQKDPPGRSRNLVHSQSQFQVTRKEVGQREMLSRSPNFALSRRTNFVHNQPRPNTATKVPPKSTAKDRQCDSISRHLAPSLKKSEEERRVGRERTVSGKPSSKRHIVSAKGTKLNVERQCKSNMTREEGGITTSIGHIEPSLPPKHLNDFIEHGSHVTSGDDSRHDIGSESNFAHFRRNGGKTYNEEGMSKFFKEKIHQNSTVNGEGKRKNLGQKILNEFAIDEPHTYPVAHTNDDSHDRGRNGGDSGIQKKSKALHFIPPSALAMQNSAGKCHQRHKSMSVDLAGISAEALMTFVLAKSAHFDQSPRKKGNLESRLMDQVACLSIGSGDGESFDGDIEDPKFSVLREVVKLYMNGERSKNENSALKGKNFRIEEDGVSKSDSYPRQECHVYKLGDEGRRRDMIKDDDKDVALMRIASLQPDDPAWIRRTTGRWTYARVKRVTSDSIVFIVNPNGSSKAYNVKYWVSHIRTLKDPALNNSFNIDPFRRRGAFAKEKSESRFSTKNLRQSTPSDEEGDW